MILQLIIVALFIYSLFWLGKLFTWWSSKYQERTEEQFQAMASNLNMKLDRSYDTLQRGAWYPPKLIGDAHNVIIRETHYGDTWTPFTVLELNLHKNQLCQKRLIVEELNQNLKSANIRLYRGQLRVKGDKLFFEMPMLLYNEKLRSNFERIIGIIQSGIQKGN